MELSTERLVIRPWTLADIDDAHALWGDARVMELLSRDGAMTRAESAARLEREMASQAAHGFQYWRVATRADGVFVGCCGLKHTDADGELVVETGFHLVPAAWGRGFATEASRRVVEHAFVDRRVERLYAGHHPRNAASERVLAKLGFQRLGTRLYPPTGLDHPWYVLRNPSSPSNRPPR
jgi:[ribosomal protein S5]-alanine N-acetyltransferase